MTNLQWERIAKSGKVEKITRAEAVTMIRAVYDVPADIAEQTVAEHERTANREGSSGMHHAPCGTTYQCRDAGSAVEAAQTPASHGEDKADGGTQWPMAPAHPAIACGLALPLHVPADGGSPIEHAITRGLISALRGRGFVPVAVWDSEEYQTAEGVTVTLRESRKWTPRQLMTVAEVLDAVFAVDAISTIHFAPRGDLSAWGGHGVAVVPGNGIDFISDYHSHAGVWSDTLDAFGAALLDDNKHALVIVTGADIAVAKP